MRPKERIPIFFELVDWDKLSKRWGLKKNISNHILNHVPYINVSKYWLENYDQRIGQVLINLNLIQDDLEIWMDEETDILLDQGVEPIEFPFWKSILDKEGNPLEEPITRSIKDLDTDRIYAIKKWAKDHNQMLPKYYNEAFNKELKIRENEKLYGKVNSN